MPPLEDDVNSDAFSEAEEIIDDGIEEREALDAAAARRRFPDEVDDEDSEEEGEDLFDENMDRDYEADPELDRYDETMLDDSGNQRELTAAERREVERDLRARERAHNEVERGPSGGRRTGGIAAMFANLGLSDESDNEEDAQDRQEAENRKRRLRQMREQRNRAQRPDSEIIEQAKTALPECDIAEMGGLRGMPLAPAKLWNDRVKELVSVIFEGVLWCSDFTEEGIVETGAGDHMAETGGSGGAGPEPQVDMNQRAHYITKLQEMVRDEKTSLSLDWSHIAHFCPRLCDWIQNLPQQLLGVFDEVATRIVLLMYPSLYKGLQVAVRIANHLAVESIRNLNTSHINKLIVVEGVCMRRSDVLPRLDVVWYECVRCGCDTNGPFDQRAVDIEKLTRTCMNCQGHGPFNISRERTVFQNYQKVVLQELTSAVPAGNVPRQKVVILLGDLADRIRPGDDLIVTGILEARQDSATNAKLGFPVFNTWVVANQVQKRRERQIKDITERDVEYIKRLSRNPMIREKIISSVAPSIWGHRHIKTAIALVMFGGVRNEVAGRHVVRGDINLLIIGDPGLGKSQFLKYVEQTFPRTVLTTGKGASAVGLTAAVRRDPMSGEWTLEGGAFVLADEGICLIDEFDKMSDRDRVSIHEAMEQQSISISKAGIVTSLRARCSVIAAANPIFGRYDASLTLADNVDLTDPILSRFDIIAVVRDQSYPISDEHLASHVIESHIDAHPDADEAGAEDFRGDTSDEPDWTLDGDGYPKWIQGSGRIPDAVLRQYIIYARKYCQPELRSQDEERLTTFYSKLREATSRNGGLPMTVRHLESIMRMATANAKMRLARYADHRDISFAISTMLESFIQSQKYAVSVDLGRRFGRYRALAASPEEVLDSLLLEMLTLAREMAAHLTSDDKRADASAKIMKETDVQLNEFKLLAKSLHGLPEVVVQSFTGSQRFKSKYSMTHREGEAFILTRPLSV